MNIKLTLPTLEISETEGFTAEKDIFNRKPFGEVQAIRENPHAHAR